MIDFGDLRQWIIGTALLFFAGALVVKSLPDRIRRKLLSVGAVVFIIGSVFATISAQKSECPDDDSNDGDMGGTAELLIPSCVTDSASLRSTNDMEDDPDGGDVWCLTNRISFDSFAMTTTSRVFGIGWSQGLSSYFPLLDLAYKQDLTNEEWSVFKTEDIGGSLTNGIVIVVPTAQMPTNSVSDKAFYTAFMRKDPNPQRNTDGDYWPDRDELGFVEVLSGADYLWFELADIGTDLIYPARRKDYLWKRVDFVANHVLGDSVCNAAQVGLDGYVYFRDIESPFDDECCPVIHTVEIDPTADARYWGSGVYCGSVVTNGVTYDVLEFLNIGLFDCYGMSSSPLVSYEVILSSAEPDVVYVSYANVDAEFLSRQERIGYVDSTRTSVFDPELPYRLACHDGGGAICPYTTVRYNIGTGTDPRVYDAYDYPIYGQTDAERMFVETSVGYGLTNGLYELKATLTEVPVSPVVITVGDDVIVMTNAGDCVFLCEKGKPYSLSVSPSFSPDVEFTACDDIAPAMMSGALRSTGWGGAEWTVDNRLTLDQPFGGVPGYCLWLPTFTAGPGVSSHWYPGDGALSFSAYLIDYPGTNHVSYSWSCTNSDVVIDSPSSQSTSVRLAGNPGWGVASLTASAILDGYTLTSELENIFYGTNENPRVSLVFNAPDALFVNSNGVDGVKMRWFHIGFSSDISPSGIIKIDYTGADDVIKLWTSSNRIGRIHNHMQWNASEFSSLDGYIEGCRVSDFVNDVSITVTYIPDSGEEVSCLNRLTVVDPLAVKVVSPTEDSPLVMIGSPVEFELDYSPAGFCSGYQNIWSFRRMRYDGTYSEWTDFSYDVGTNGAMFSSDVGGIFQIKCQCRIGGQVEERYFIWESEDVYGLYKIGSLKSIGVAESAWQTNLVRCAERHLGSTAYLSSANLPAQYGFSSYPTSRYKCNIFVAHRIRECGMIVPDAHGVFNNYPPVANEWADEDFSIGAWVVVPNGDFPQPGFVFSDPSEDDSGHMGILDFDGAGISAGVDNVNRGYKFEWVSENNGKLRKLNED